MKLRHKFSAITLCVALLMSCMVIMPIRAQAANPYLPLWERIPDGEPRVFTNKEGEERVYIYGSHDTNDAYYCGYDHVVWSAPIDDLNNWRYDGVCFRIEQLNGVNVMGTPYEVYPTDVLYAPDAVYNPKTGLYYLYVFAFREGTNPKGTGGDRMARIFVASSDDPAGPFTNPIFSNVGWTDVDHGTPAREIIINGNPLEENGGFDPGVLVDVDNPDANGNPRVFMYWGLRYQYMCELEPDMATVKPGTVYGGVLSHFQTTDGPFGFFEASSPRKIGDKYVLVYSGRNVATSYAGDISGSPGRLVYAYADSPFGPWTYGGTIVNNWGQIVQNPNGAGYIKSATGGNNHGGLMQINGQWYIFYHRHANNSYRRNGMVEPVDVKIVDGELVIPEVESTSQGFEVDGLNPYVEQNAGIACYLVGRSSSASTYPSIHSHTYSLSDWDPNSTDQGKDWNPVINIQRNSWVGYKYFDFGSGAKPWEQMKMTLTLQASRAGNVKIYVSQPRTYAGQPETAKTLIGTMTFEQNSNTHTIETYVDNVTGRKALYFQFDVASGTNNSEICKINKLKFTLERAQGEEMFVSAVKTLVSDCAANVIVRVEGENLGGLKASLFGKVAALENGKATLAFSAAEITAAGIGKHDIIILSGDETVGGTEIEIVPLNPGIWNPYVRVDNGRLLVIFEDEVTLLSTADCVSIGDGKHDATVLEDKRTIEIDTAAPASGVVISIKGVKYSRLFPSYSFTFKVAVSE